MTNFFKKQFKQSKKYFLFSFLFLFVFAFSVLAIDRYEAGIPFEIGEFVFDDDYVPTTTPCTISIYTPGGANAVVINAPMTASTSGWHSYSYVTSSTGTYPTTMTCGIASIDLITADKTFIVFDSSSGDPSASEIASAVWSSSTRTLTSTSTATAGEVATAVWGASTRTLSAFGALAADVWNGTYAAVRTLTSGTAPSASDVASAVWSSSTRTLTNNGNDVTADQVASAVWSSSTRTLTSGAAPSAGEVASAVWSSSTRSLTTYGTLAADTATAVWGSGSRTLTAFGSLAADVWNDTYASTRRLTDKVLTGGGNLATETYINSATSTLMTQILNNQTLINNLNDISATDVWAAGTRTLTDYSTSSVASASADAVWSKASNQLTAAGTIGKQISDNLNDTISSRGTSNLTAADVWAAATRTLTDYSTSSITNAVWANAARTLTNYGNDITAQDVWNVLTSAITTDNTIGKQIKTNLDTTISSRGTSNLTNVDLNTATSTIVAEILNNRTLINNLHNITAADVWAAGTRTLTDYSTSVIAQASAREVWDIASSSLGTSGSVGKHLVDNINTTISSRGTSNLTAADVWTAGTRTLTDYSTSSVASAAASAVWANAARTLTNYGNDITAADVWNVMSATLATEGSIGKQLAQNANTSTIATAIWNSPARTLTSFGTLAADTANAVWNSGSRTLTAFGALAADVWNDAYAPTRRLSDKTLTGGGSLATEAYINTATSSIITEILSNRTLINNLNDISAADVWAYGSRSLTSGISPSASEIASAVWSSSTRSLTNYGNNLSATDVWSFGNRALTDYSTSSIASAAASAVWNNSQRELTKSITASDIWHWGNRSLTDYSTSSIASAVWNKPTSELILSASIGKLITSNLDAQVSTVGGGSLTAADIWSYATRSLTDYSTSTVASAVTNAVWANAARTLTNYGNDITAQDVWNVLTSALTTENSIGKVLATNNDVAISSRSTLSGQTAVWNVSMSNTASMQLGKTYRAKVFVLNSSSTAAAPFATPRVTLYDADRNAVVSNIAMTAITTGVYEYTYNIPSNASQGIWETVVTTEVENGKTITNNDYWEVAGSPAQVILNSVSMNASSTPNVSANLTVTNEGLAGYEYQYEWCIVSDINNACGGGDDVYRGTGAKYINPGEDWNTNLNGSVSKNGEYYFKVIVYFGTEKSGSSRTFTATGISSGGGSGTGTGTGGGTGGGSGGGGGGGGGSETSSSNSSLVPIYETRAGVINLNADQAGVVKASTIQGIVVNISIPAKSLNSPSTISVVPVLSGNSIISQATSEGMYLVGNMVFDVNSSNKQTKFDDPLTLTFVYTPSQIKGLDENTLVIRWYDEYNNKWNNLPTTIDKTKHTLTARANHISLFAIFGQAESGSIGGCNGADFNKDKKVNSVDFSILLSFWKTKYPFTNSCVDINGDREVNSKDFSILLSQWGGKGVAYKTNTKK